MKKMRIGVALLALCLCACGAEETLETVSDEIVQPVAAQMQQIYLELPGEAASPAVESGADRLYQCETYDIRVQTLTGGDLDSTIRELTGYQRESLTVMHSVRDNLDCYEFVWASAGEDGDLVGRAMILDDGSYHYCVSVLGDADWASENQVHWEAIFDSFRLS